MYKSYAYWISIVIGALIVFWLSSQSIEKFFDPTSTASTATGAAAASGTGAAAASGTGAAATGTGAVAATGTGATGAAASVGTGAAAASVGTGAAAASGTGAAATGMPSLLQDMPYANSSPKRLLLYLNAFNVNPGSTPLNTTYYCNNASWCDAKQSGVQFSLFGAYVPSTITGSGLSLKNIRLQGPPSNTIADGNDNLTSFSVLFYATFNSLNFTTNNPIIWFQLFAETPNKVMLSINPNPTDQNSVYIQLLLGDMNNLYRWEIPIATIMSAGNTTLYALIFNNDPVTPTATFYIGNLAYEANLDVVTGGILLGLSPIKINSSLNLDISLLAFAYYNIILSSIDLFNISQYFMYQATGYATLSNLQLQTQANNIQLQSQLSQMTDKIQQLQGQINTCGRNNNNQTQNVNMPKPKHWQINMQGNDDISVSDMKQCSPLSLKYVPNTLSTSTNSFASKLNSAIANVQDDNTGIGIITDPTTMTASALAAATSAAAAAAASRGSSSAGSGSSGTTAPSATPATSPVIINPVSSDVNFQQVYNNLVAQAQSNISANPTGVAAPAATVTPTAPQTTSTSSKFWDLFR